MTTEWDADRVRECGNNIYALCTEHVPNWTVGESGLVLVNGTEVLAGMSRAVDVRNPMKFEAAYEAVRSRFRRAEFTNVDLPPLPPHVVEIYQDRRSE
jgi:hypothetical protein